MDALNPKDEPVVTLGPVSHIGIAVKDAAKTAAFFTRVFGLKFDIADFNMEELAEYYLVDGKPNKPSFKAALAYDGDFFIEIVEVTSDHETVHTRHIKNRGEGLQHLCFKATNTKAILEKLKKEGIEPTIDYQFVTNQNGKKVRIHEVYLNTEEFVGGTTIQLLEYIPEE